MDIEVDADRLACRRDALDRAQLWVHLQLHLTPPAAIAS